MKPTMKDLILSLLQSYDELLNCKGSPEDPPPLAKEFFSVKSQSTKYKMQKTYPTTAGESEHNTKKNRYKDILPFDYTRFVLPELDGVPGSDYINANYLKGHDGKPVYIAAQGPLPQTVIDFWRLIWESNAQIVVMACNEYELGKHKCQKYWCDENETQQFGEITVQQISQECITKDFLIRKLFVSKHESEKEIYQFHYTSWPDHGVPSSVEAIIHMVKKMREYQVGGNMPFLIHCSAGCGRTGTICVIDYVRNLLLDEMIDENFSLKSIILEMRKQRHAIVQTKEQYELVHRATATLFRETLQEQFGRTYENWTIEHEVLPKPEAHKVPPIQTHQPELPRKFQISDGVSPKVDASSKPVKPLKPPILSNKPSSPLPGKQPVLPSTQTADSTIANVRKPKQDRLNVHPSPTQRHSYDSVLDSIQGPKLTNQRLSEDSKIAGVQNLLLQHKLNLTGGLQSRPEVTKRLPVTQKKPPENPKKVQENAKKLFDNIMKPTESPKKPPENLKKPSESPKPAERKPNPRNAPPLKVQHHPVVSSQKNMTSKGKNEEVHLEQSREYEVVQPPPERKKKPPIKPQRNELHIQFNQPIPQRMSFPPHTDNVARKFPPRGEYAYVDHSSHLNEVLARERFSGTVESPAYESVDLDPNYDVRNRNNSVEKLVPYAYTDIDSATPKSDARRTLPANSASESAYEDVTPQVDERQKPTPRANVYVNEDSAYAEVGDYAPPQDTRDDSFDDDDDVIPVVPERTRAMYQTIDEIEEMQTAPTPATKHFAPFATLNKFLTKNRPRLPDFSNPPSSSQSSQQNHQQQLPQQKVGEHTMEINEAIRNATFAIRETYMPGPVTYENIDISYPKKVHKPKPERSSPWRDTYSLHYKM